MTASIIHLPSRQPTAALSDQMAAALAMKHAIDATQLLVNLPAGQVAMLVPDQLDTLAGCLTLLAERARVLREVKLCR